MSESVWRLTIRSSETSTDVLSGALYRAGYEGLEIVSAAPGTAETMVRAYAVTRTGIEEISRVVSEVPGCALAEIEEVRLADWAEEWKRHFQAVEIGARLIVVPPWQEVSKRTEGRVAIVIEPGHAFGTGTHASTRLVLGALQDVLPRLPPDGAVVDLGCGSGILAIAAAKLGLAPCVGIDIDEEAVDSARENADRNGVASLIRFLVGDARDVPDRCRLVLANLSAPIHREIAAGVAGRIVPGGVAVLSGMLRDEVDGVAALWPDGWETVRAFEDEWALLAIAAPPVAR